MALGQKKAGIGRAKVAIHLSMIRGQMIEAKRSSRVDVALLLTQSMNTMAYPNCHDPKLIPY